MADPDGFLRANAAVAGAAAAVEYAVPFEVIAL